MAITFRVDDVQAIGDRLPIKPMEEALKEKLGVDLHHVSHHADLIAQGQGFHPLLDAVHLAFAQHRPLSISPDHVWLTLSQGFAVHMEQNAEALRKRFVRHDGKKELIAEVLELPTTSEAWGAVVGAFGTNIAEHVGAGIHRLLACSFTTTTDIERVASGVVMMSAFKRYFDYSMICICGIPEITLEGTAADWSEIRRRVDVLAEYDLEWWAAALGPILDQFVQSAEGKPNSDFWQCIYKPKEVYGGEVSTGWIMRLFPYLDSREQNPSVLKAGAASMTMEGGRERWIGPGISPTSVPMAWSNARLKVVKTNGETTTLTLFGGFAGVRQTDIDKGGALRPEVAWVVGATPRMTRIVERILSEHSTTTKNAGPGSSAASDENVEEDVGPRYVELPAEMIELYERMESAVLFGRWRIVARKDLVTVVGDVETGFEGLDGQRAREDSYNPGSSIPVVPFCLLDGDPRYVALYEDKVVLCDPRLAQDVEHIPVIAMSVADFFEKLFVQEGKPWFDDEPSGVVLYPHLSGYHEHLRRALREPAEGEAVPTDLSEREKRQLVMSLCFKKQKSEAQRALWWEALRLATGTKHTFESVFRQEKGRYPLHVLADLGLS